MGLARLYGLVGKRFECHDWAKRGLVELEEMRRDPVSKARRDSDLFPADILDQAEQQLHSYLEL
jgi:hypothetical protein